MDCTCFCDSLWTRHTIPLKEHWLVPIVLFGALEKFSKYLPSSLSMTDQAMAKKCDNEFVSLLVHGVDVAST